MSTKQMKKMGYVILVVFIVSIFYLFGPGCPQQALFGISCLGCGMTRAYLQLFQGNVKGALFYHPLFPIVPFAAFFLFFKKKIPKVIFNITMIFIFTLFLFVYLYRLSMHDPVLKFDIKEGWLYQLFILLRNIFLKIHVPAAVFHIENPVQYCILNLLEIVLVPLFPLLPKQFAYLALLASGLHWK